MAEQKRLNDLLKWSITNTNTDASAPAADTNGAAPAALGSNLTPEIMEALMGGPSDADLMKASMEIIGLPDAEANLENKLIAFDNFEQMIENLDNANNIANLGLWTPLLEQLKNPEAEMRKMAAWCIGTAVQNNVKTQERLFAVGGLPPLVALATSQDEVSDVRRKAVYALSSACRNYQPAMDLCAEELTKGGRATGQVDATDMEAIDTIMNELREKAKAA